MIMAAIRSSSKMSDSGARTACLRGKVRRQSVGETARLDGGGAGGAATGVTVVVVVVLVHSGI